MDWAPAMPFWRRSPKGAPWYRPRQQRCDAPIGGGAFVASQVACSEAMPYLKMSTPPFPRPRKHYGRRTPTKPRCVISLGNRGRPGESGGTGWTRIGKWLN